MGLMTFLRSFGRRRPTPTPAPVPVTPPALPSRYVLLNCINWEPALLKALPFSAISEATYFVTEISATGQLKNIDAVLESEFVTNVHNARKKATFSIAGGAQNIPDITNAVVYCSDILIESIATHLMLYGYDGVTLDIENTDIPAAAMVRFVNALRAKFDTIRPGLIIGCYIQAWQLSTVWGKIEEAMGALTWVSPMLYDAGYYDKATWVNTMKAVVTRTGASKSLIGLAVGYPAQDGGLSPEQYNDLLPTVISEGWMGVGLWQNVIFTSSFQYIQKSRFNAI